MQPGAAPNVTGAVDTVHAEDTVDAEDEASALAPTLPMRRVAARAAPAPSGPALLDGVVWRDAALAWLAQRILFVACVYFGELLLTAHPTPNQATSWSRLFRGVFAWDANIYATIAREGYAHHWETAFYPLFPGLEHLLMGPLGGNSAAAGLAIANLAALLAFGLLRVLVERELGRPVARRALLYLVCFPTAFFLVVPYTEALFLLLSLACFLALRRRHWLLAGLFAALAELTRPVGILLVAPLVVEFVAQQRVYWRGSWGPSLRAWRRSAGRRRELAALIGGACAPLLALGAFSFALRSRLSGPTPISAELASGWGRNVTLPGMGFARAGWALVQSGLAPNYYQAHILLDGVFTLLFIALAVASWRRVPLAYVSYAWATLAVILLTPSHTWLALGSNMRFMLVVFPLFMLLGQWGKRQWVDRLILCLSLPLLALFTLTFVSLGWVA